MTTNITKDARERTPREQAANFAASMGGLIRTSRDESKPIAADLADFIVAISKTTNPQLVALACSRALREWSDVTKANPAHAAELAGLASRSAKRAIPAEPTRDAAPLAIPQQRRVATPKARTP